MVDRVARRRAGVALFATVATFATFIAAAVSVAACTSLATLEASGSAVPLGQLVTLNGRHFATDPSLSPIEVRDSTTNVLLWSGRPDENGDFTASIPTAGFAAGYHVIVASEVDAHGQAVSGTPARVVVNVISSVERAKGAPGSDRTPAAAAARTTTAHAFPTATLLAVGAGAALLALCVWRTVRAVAQRSRRRARERNAALDMWERSLSNEAEVVTAQKNAHSRSA